MKKTIIIIVILALAGFCVYWFGFRKKDEGSAVKGGDGSDTDNPLNGGVLTDKTSTDSIVDSLSLPGTAAACVKGAAANALKNVDAGSDWGIQIKEKASGNKLNIAQQCVLEALWFAYDEKKLIVWSEFEEACKKVKSL